MRRAATDARRIESVGRVDGIRNRLMVGNTLVSGRLGPGRPMEPKGIGRRKTPVRLRLGQSGSVNSGSVRFVTFRLLLSDVHLRALEPGSILSKRGHVTRPAVRVFHRVSARLAALGYGPIVSPRIQLSHYRHSWLRKTPGAVAVAATARVGDLSPRVRSARSFTEILGSLWRTLIRFGVRTSWY